MNYHVPCQLPSGYVDRVEDQERTSSNEAVCRVEQNVYAGSQQNSTLLAYRLLAEPQKFLIKTLLTN